MLSLYAVEQGSHAFLIILFKDFSSTFQYQFPQIQGPNMQFETQPRLYTVQHYKSYNKSQQAAEKLAGNS